ncbi:MAG: DUF4886 domain-containing protein [Flavobacteriales bacterium]
MRTISLFGFLFILCNPFLAQDTLRTLFIGNSYTAVNNLPQMISDVATAQGDVLIFQNNTPGGQTFQMHANNTLNYQLMHAQDWDYVVLQGQSQEPSFPTAQVNSQTLPYALQLADSVNSILPCAQVNFYMTWGRQNGDPQWDSISTFEGMNTRLRAAYLRFADSANAGVSPVGVAWKYVRDNYPAINLYQQDGSHPSMEGSYLAACVFYSSLFQKSCIGNNFNPGISQADADILQQVASTIVLDSLALWNLILPDQLLQASAAYSGVPGASLFAFTATSNFPATYTWYFPDMTIETGQNIGFEYNLSSYQVMLIATGLCDTDTVLIDVNNPNAQVKEFSALQWKQIGPQQIAINGHANLIIEAFDQIGKSLPVSFQNTPNTTEISYPANTFILKIETGTQHFFLKIPLQIN